MFRRAEFHDALTSLRAFSDWGLVELAPPIVPEAFFCHAAILRGKYGSGQFPSMLPSSFHFDAAGRLHFISARPARDDGSLPRINTLQPKRSNGVVVRRVTIRWPRERTMAAMSESRRGSGPFAWRSFLPKSPPRGIEI